MSDDKFVKIVGALIFGIIGVILLFFPDIVKKYDFWYETWASKEEYESFDKLLGGFFILATILLIVTLIFEAF